MPAEAPSAGDTSGRQVSPSLGQVPWTLPRLRLLPGSDLPSLIPPLAFGWLSAWDATLLDLELQASPPQRTLDHSALPLTQLSPVTLPSSVQSRELYPESAWLHICAFVDCLPNENVTSTPAENVCLVPTLGPQHLAQNM